MASVHKITLGASRDIPFNRLVLSQSTVRRVKAGVSIEELTVVHQSPLTHLHVTGQIADALAGTSEIDLDLSVIPRNPPFRAL